MKHLGRTLRRQLWALLGLALLGGGLTLLLWLHPTLGRLPSGILKGLDVRSEMIQILWLEIGVLAAVATGVLSLLTFLTRRPHRWYIAYLLGTAAVMIAWPLIDRYY